MSATTAPAVKKRLVELFKGVVEPPTEVWFNRPNEEHQIAENAYVGGVKLDREWKYTGRPRPHQREENYTIEVDVEVYRSGTDAEGTEERLWVIVNQLEGVIASDETLGGQENVQWALVHHVEQSSEGGSDGWVSRALLEVAVVARI